MHDKATVRAAAERLGLRVAAKPDSQDLCFVPTGGYADVLGKLRPEALTPGEIVSEDGAVLGRHDGVGRYTVGQAKRLGTAQNGHRVVVALDPAARRVVVGSASGGRQQVRLREVNWLVPAAPRACTVKLRAREAPHAAEVIPTEDGALVHLATPSLAAPGQACVFYDGERVLGGGFIQR